MNSMLFIRMDVKGTMVPSEEGAKCRVGTIISEPLLILVPRKEAHSLWYQAEQQHLEWI